MAVWQPLQQQAGLWLVQVRQAAEGALRRPSTQAQLGVVQEDQGVAVKVVEGQAAAVQQPHQAALRVRAKQAQQFRVVFVLAVPAFFWPLRCQLVCLLQADSPHAILVPALLFEQVAGWL